MLDLPCFFILIIFIRLHKLFLILFPVGRYGDSSYSQVHDQQAFEPPSNGRRRPPPEQVRIFVSTKFGQLACKLNFPRLLSTLWCMNKGLFKMELLRFDNFNSIVQRSCRFGIFWRTALPDPYWSRAWSLSLGMFFLNLVTFQIIFQNVDMS